MSFDQVKDVLEQARQFHRYTADFYNQLSKKSERQRVKMLLDYMARREKNFEAILEKYQREAADIITETWIQFTPSKAITEKLEALEARPVKSVEELMEIAVEIDRELLEYYRTLVSTAPRPEIREAFANLLETTLQKERELLFNIRIVQDI